MNLTDDEKHRAAMACRVAAVQAEKDAALQTNPQTRKTFNEEERRYRELADKFERAARAAP